MKKLILTIVYLFLIFNCFAQNIGINNTDPKTALDITGGFRTRADALSATASGVTIPLNKSFIWLEGSPAADFIIDIATGYEDGARMVIYNSTGKTGNIAGGGEELASGKMVEIIWLDGEWRLTNTNLNIYNWSINGNTGTIPAFHFIGNTDNQPLVFKTGNTERMRLTNTGLEMSNEIKPGGVAGTNGQVLQSNGDGTMSWANAAYNNNTRFQVRFEDNTASTNASAPLDFMWYNLNTTDVTIHVPTNTFTINKSGLYHFDVDLEIKVNTVANPTTIPFLNISLAINGSTRSINVGSFVPRKLDDKSQWELNGSKSFDLYIDGSSAITLPYFFANITGTKTIKCIVNGHLINE